jgi:hypothetical protein
LSANAILNSLVSRQYSLHGPRINLRATSSTEFEKREEYMKRFFLITIPIGVLFACTVATTTAVPLTATPTATQTPPQEISVLVYFTMSNDVEMTPVRVPRIVPNSENLAPIVHSTLEELLKGPTDAEKAQGLISWFSPTTAHSLTSVTVSGGEIAINFSGLNSIIPNASTSAGSQMLLSQLNGTVFQFPSLQNIHYSLDGDCAAFWEWLQYDCHVVTRGESG